MVPFAFSYDYYCSFVNNFIFLKKLIISIECSLKNIQNFFIQYLPLYTLYFFSMFLNDNIVDIQKLDGRCTSTFIVDELSGLFLQPSIFSTEHSISA